MEYNVVVGKFGAFYVNPGPRGDGLDDNDSASLTPCTTAYPPGTPVMQYAGIKDTNGIDIYVGDILVDKSNGGNLLEVKFGELPLNKGSDCVCCYQAFYCEDHGKAGEPPWYDCVELQYWMERIGNVYQNPELLKP